MPALVSTRIGLWKPNSTMLAENGPKFIRIIFPCMMALYRRTTVRERQRRRRASRTEGKPREGRASQTALHDSQLPLGMAFFKGRAMWACPALIVATLMVYAPVPHYDFVSWDDPIYVSENPHVAAGLTWQGVSWAFTTGHAGYWMPPIWLSYMLDVRFYGLNAGGHHVTNLLLHIANTLLLFGLFHRMTGALGRSAFVAGLFALHPLHVESVAWVTERKDVLSTFFGILTLWAYVAWVRRPSRGRYFGVLVLLALSLMAKPMLVTLPLVLLLLDFWPLGRVPTGAGRDQRAAWLRLAREKLPLFAIILVSSIVTFLAQRSGGAVADLGALPLSFRVSNALVSYVVYIGKAVWPVRLANFYPLPKSLSGWSILGAILALAVVSVLVMRAARRYPYLPVGWLWYLVTLVPVIGLVQVGRQVMADRFTYVPLIGLFMMVAWGIPDLLAGWPTRRIPLAAAAGLILMVYAITARGQVEFWKDSTSLWTRALEVTTDNAVAHNNLGRILFLQGNFDEAVAHYTEALRLAPDDADTHNNLANALARHGTVAEALTHYSEALRITPDFAEAHNNMANALARQGRVAEALANYSEALRIKPEYAEAHNGFGALLAGQGRSGEALAHYSEAVHIDPNYAEAHNNMGALLLGQGKTDEAIREFSEAVRINPAKPEFHYNLGLVLKNKRQINEAVGQFNAALRLKPDYQDARHALDTLGGGSSIPAPANR